METEEIISGINSLSEDLVKHVLASYEERGMDYGNERYQSWRKKVEKFLDESLPYESQRFKAKKSLMIFSGRWQTPAQSFWSQDGERVNSYLESLTIDLEDGSYEAPVPRDIFEEEKKSVDALVTIRNTCDKFHRVVKQLRSRYSDRNTLDVNDEYDVQDLLHSLLHLDFEDIRAEDWVPSNAGKSTRVDFVLKNEKIIIEVKKTRRGLAAKEVSSQLIEDIHRYQSHPDCKTLVCFVYDPEERISNPRGIERDLSKDEDGFKVKVWIRP
jgi:hypothetical protein